MSQPNSDNPLATVVFGSNSDQDDGGEALLDNIHHHRASTVEDPPAEPFPRLTLNDYDPITEDNSSSSNAEMNHLPNPFTFHRAYQRLSQARRIRRRRISLMYKKSLRLLRKSGKLLKIALKKNKKSLRLIKNCFRLFVTTDLNQM